jgi:hypothetical protein
VLQFVAFAFHRYGIVEHEVYVPVAQWKRTAVLTRMGASSTLAGDSSLCSWRTGRASASEAEWERVRFLPGTPNFLSTFSTNKLDNAEVMQEVDMPFPKSGSCGFEARLPHQSCAYSSMVEPSPHKGLHAGSIPAARTT